MTSGPPDFAQEAVDLCRLMPIQGEVDAIATALSRAYARGQAAGREEAAEIAEGHICLPTDDAEIYISSVAAAEVAAAIRRGGDHG